MSHSSLLFQVIFVSAVLGEEVLEDPAIAAQRAREKQLTNFMLTYTVKQTRYPVKGTEYKLESSGKITMKEALARFESTREIYKGGQRVEQMRITRTYNENVAKQLHSIPSGSKTEVTGIINNMNVIEDFSDIETVPLTLFFRSLDRVQGLANFAVLSQTEKRELINERQCVKYILTRPQYNTYHCWLAPDQGYTLQRLIDQRRGQVRYQFDIRYIETPLLPWQIDSWTCTMWDENQHKTTYLEGKVTEFVLNPPITEQTFDITFPEGIFVQDQRTSPPTDFKVVAGELQPVDREGNWLPATEPTPREIVYLFSAIAVLLFLLAVWLLLHKRSHRGRDNEP